MIALDAKFKKNTPVRRLSIGMAMETVQRRTEWVLRLQEIKFARRIMLRTLDCV